MKEVLHFIEHELVTRLLSGKKPLATPSRAEQFFWALCGLFLVAGTVFLIYAAHLWLVGLYSADAAAALTGAISMACALLVASVLCAIAAYRRMRVQQIQHSLYKQLEASLRELEEEFGEPVRDHPKTSVFLASLLGLLFERRML